MPMATVHTLQLSDLTQTGKLINDLRNVPMTMSNRRLAPAPMDQSRCKKKPSYQQLPYTSHQPASVARRNARERNRVKQVNNGFAALRQHIPSAISAALAGGRGASRKLSKVDTLKLAVEYIRSLQRLLSESGEGETPGSSEASPSPAPSLSSDAACAPDAYDSYEPMSPEDEELLDVISWWQQQ